MVFNTLYASSHKCVLQNATVFSIVIERVIARNLFLFAIFQFSYKYWWENSTHCVWLRSKQNQLSLANIIINCIWKGFKFCTTIIVWSINCGFKISVCHTMYPFILQIGMFLHNVNYSNLDQWRARNFFVGQMKY